MFKRNGLYYALVSEACCYCQQGAYVHAFMSDKPLGPYTYTGEIAQGPNPFGGSVSTSAQQTDVFAVPAADGTVTFLWQGDRWQSAPQINGQPPLKSDDFTYWTPLSFAANGTVLNMQWEDTVTVDV